MKIAPRCFVLIAALVFSGIYVTACSGSDTADAGRSQMAEQSPSSTRATSNKPVYLYNLMQQKAFVTAFKAMNGVGKLPAWVAKGGTATPAMPVMVDGESMLASQACKPHDCAAQSIMLLFNKRAGHMEGVFVRDPAPGPNAGISDKAKLTWLGNPDAKTQAWLETQLESP